MKAHHHGHRAALLENVDPVIAQAFHQPAEVHFQLALEGGDFGFIHQAVGQLAHDIGRQRLVVDGQGYAVNLDLRRRFRREKDVAGLFVGHQLEKWQHQHGWVSRSVMNGCSDSACLFIAYCACSRRKRQPLKARMRGLVW
jgi:hypothetical protein